jgi:tight adherence protein B
LLASGALLETPPLLWPVLAVLPTALWLTWLLLRRRRRIHRIEAELPLTFDALANAMKAGQSLPVALQSAVDASHPPLQEELEILSEGLNLGASLDELLHDLARRVPSPEVRFFVAALRMQLRGGENTTKVLAMVSDSLRERQQLARQVHALSAEGRLSAVVLIALPFLAFGGVYYLAPDYLMVLFEDELGRRMVVGAVLLQVLGIVTISKLVNVQP